MVGSLWFVGARLLAHRWLLAVLLTVVLVVTAGLTTMTMFLADAAQSGTRSAVDRAPMSARAVQLTTELSTDEAAQNIAADHMFGTAFAGLPVRVHRAVAGAQLAVVAARQDRSTPPSERVFELRTFDDLAGHARVVAGSWPAAKADGGIAIAVPTGPTGPSGWRVGDRATIAGDDSGTVLRVAALYRPLDEQDPYFLPQPGSTSAGPVVIAVGEGDLEALSSSPSALWTISPNTSRLGAADALPFMRALAGLERLASNYPGVNVRGVRLSGGLPGTLTTIVGSLAAVRGVAVLPILLTAGLGVVLIGVITASLARTRRQELAVLRGRGLGRARITAWGAAEGAFLAVPAALVGTLLSVWIRPWVQSGAGPSTAEPVPWWPAVLVIAAVLTASVTVTVLEFRTGTVGARAAAVGSIIPVVLLLAAGAVTVWRFRTSGSAVATTASGATTLDPVAAPAPAVGLVALAVLGTLLAAVVARAVAVATGRRRGLDAVLPAREVSRRWATFGAAVMLVALAVAAGVLTAAYDGTQRAFTRSSALLDNSADVRVDLPDSFAAAGVEPSATGLHTTAVNGAQRATDALVAPVTIGSTAGELVAASPADLAAFVPVIPGGYDPERVAGTLSSTPSGLGLPAGPQEITVGLSVTAAAARPDLRDPRATAPAPAGFVGVRPVLWISTPGGVQAVQGKEVRIPVAAADAVAMPVTQPVTIPLPAADPADDASTVVAVDTVLDTQGLDTVDSVRIDGIPTTGASSGAGPVTWRVAELQDGDDALTAQPVGPGGVSWDGPVAAGPIPRTIRLMPSSAGSSDGAVTGEPASVKIVINQLMADQFGATIGAALDLRLEATGAHVLGAVAAISPVLPGDPAVPRAMADRTAVTAQLLSTTTVVPEANEVWISTAAPGDVASQLRRLAGVGWAVTVAGERSAAALIDPARSALWMGVGVFLLLALLALALLAGTLNQDRRGDIRPLIAAGVTRREWVGLRRREVLWCLVSGAVLGLAVGVTTAVLTVGGLARSAVVGAPTQLHPVLEFSVGVLPALAAGAVGALAVLTGYGRLNAAAWARAGR